MNDTKRKWQLRRRVIYIVLAYCASTIAYLNVIVNVNSLHVTMVTSMITLSGSLILYWIAAATAEDSTKAYSKNTEIKMINGLASNQAWLLRRRVIYLMLVYGALLVTYIGFGVTEHGDIHTATVEGMLTLCSTVLLAWIFGGALQDSVVSLRQAKDNADSL